MKIEDVRSSFTVYLIASDLNEHEGLAESLGLAGYMVASFSELTQAFSEFASNPPHILLFDAEEKGFDLTKAIKQVRGQLPESHILLLTPFEKRMTAIPLLEHGIYDLIYTPLVSTVELIKSLDRAAERDYFMYLNERLTAENKKFAASGDANTPVPISDDLHMEFARSLFAAKTTDAAVQVYLKAASKSLGDCGAVYFRYISNRRVLIAASAENTDVDWNGVGVNFNEINPDFRTAQLRDPADVKEIAGILREVFGAENFFAYPVEALGEIQGVIVFLRPQPHGGLLARVQDWLTLLQHALALLESEKRLHVLTVKDPTTDLINRQNFITRVSQEISRSRRTLLPVSLALISVDQYGQIVSQLGQEEAATVLRMAARIFEKHSRVNDIIGRTGADEFGILLPHTNGQGALIKVERLRRIIESADFSRVLRSFPHVTISIGVAEYPSMVRDADELFQLADQALYQVRQEGNRTCAARPPDGFVADFRAHEKGS